MRQRLGIAQALMSRPRVLFLDEPSSALDPLGRVEILETIVRLKAEATTVFLSSHILADVERVCDVVGIIDKGQLVVQSTVSELRRRYARPIFQVEFEEAGAPFLALVERLPWVERVEVGEGAQASELRVHTSDVARAKRDLPKAVAESGLTLRQYQMVMPTLEEVFIRLLGKKEQ